MADRRAIAHRRTSFLDWCSDAAPLESYRPSLDFVVEVDLKTFIAYTRSHGCPILLEELDR